MTNNKKLIDKINEYYNLSVFAVEPIIPGKSYQHFFTEKMPAHDLKLNPLFEAHKNPAIVETATKPAVVEPVAEKTPLKYELPSLEVEPPKPIEPQAPKPFTHPELTLTEQTKQQISIDRVKKVFLDYIEPIEGSGTDVKIKAKDGMKLNKELFNEKGEPLFNEFEARKWIKEYKNNLKLQRKNVIKANKKIEKTVYNLFERNIVGFYFNKIYTNPKIIAGAVVATSLTILYNFLYNKSPNYKDPSLNEPVLAAKQISNNIKNDNSGELISKNIKETVFSLSLLAGLNENDNKKIKQISQSLSKLDNLFLEQSQLTIDNKESCQQFISKINALKSNCINTVANLEKLYKFLIAKNETNAAEDVQNLINSLGSFVKLVEQLRDIKK